MSRLGNGWTRSARVVLLGALALVLVGQVAYGAPKVVVDAKATGTPGFGAQIRGTVSYTINDGSTFRSVTWRQVSGAPARLTPLPGNAVRVRLNQAPAYFAQLMHVLVEPPVELGPPNLPFEEEEYLNGLRDRWQVVALNPFILEEAGLVVLEAKVLTTSGAYTGTVNLAIALTQRKPGFEPFAVTTGLNNVPVKQLVLLHGKNQASYSWSIISKPFASDAVLKNATTQNPSFVPDAVGKYEIGVVDSAARKTVVLTIYAGTWRGVVVGQDSVGDAVADPACANCHNGTLAPDKFSEWAATGHSKILSDNLNTSDHYGTSCLSCHSVGYDTQRTNKGMDEAGDFAAFVASDLMHGAAPGNWTTMLAQFPLTAKMSNIQCDNCHGPHVVANDTSPAHGLSGEAVGKPRVSLSSDVCATCHGEPTRHARFQQWQISGHGNYELAEDESDSGDCSRCHTGNGFLAWLPALLDDDPTNDLASLPTEVYKQFAVDGVHPQTCVTCHDPHAVGTTTADATDAPMRITGETAMLPGGFKAVGVGKGAICITCHNGRRGLRNDATFLTTDADRSTHLGPQSDVLMGQNAYFVTTGVRGRHSLIEDTCVKCHMEVSPPPAALSNAGGGTNHTFFAKADICNECHTGVDVENLQAGFESMIEDLGHLIATKVKDVMVAQIGAGNKIKVGSAVITDAATIDEIELSENHGRNAVIVHLTNGTALPVANMGTVYVVKPDASQTAFFAVSGYDLAKAWWNHNLLEADSSKGVHNPTWELEVLNKSLKALGGKRAPALTQTDLAVGMK